MADLGSLLGAAGVGGVIGKAIVSLELSTAKYNAELEAAQAKTAASTKATGGMFSSFGSVATTALAGVGVGIAALAIKGVSQFEEVGGEVRTLEKQLGLTAEQASVLRAQGEALGVGVDKLSIGFGIFSKHLVTEDDPALAKYGITVERLADGSIDMQAEIAQVHDLFERLGPTADRTAASMNLFGRSGKSLLPLLSANSDEMAQFADNAEKAGLIMSEDDVQAARALSIAQRELGESIQGLEIALARALIPAIQGTIDTLNGLLPLLTKVATAMQYLPISQMGEDFNSTASGVVKFADGLIDTIPVLGHFVDLAGDANDTIAEGGKGLGNFRGRALQASLATDALGEAAHKTDIEFADLTLTLDENAEQTKITRKEFLDATNTMQREARQLADALKTIAKEDWVNPKYVAFLSEQGPEWLRAFASLTETEQHKAQQAWQQSTKELDNARDSQDKMIGALDRLDKSTTKHTVEIEYKYVGFDPSKPGMTGSPQQR